MSDVQIQNVVATASLGQEINLSTIVEAFANATYNRRVFPGLVLKYKHPKISTLIFRTGKMVCTGAKSEKMARSAVMKVVRELNKKGLITRGRPEIDIVNIVASADLHCKIDIEEVARVLDGTVYEPEQFPGLIYRMDEPKVVMLLFVSGKLVCTGARREGMVHEAVEKLRGILEDLDLFC